MACPGPSDDPPPELPEDLPDLPSTFPAIPLPPGPPYAGRQPWEPRDDGRHEKALPTDGGETNFEEALPTTFAREGGYVDDPTDPGGETIYGISKDNHEEAWEDGPPTKEEATDIYREEYWDEHGVGKIESQEVATKTFDTVVNMGGPNGGLVAQKAVNDVITERNAEDDSPNTDPIDEDADIGPETRGAMNELIADGEKERLLDGMRQRQWDHYHSLKDGTPDEQERYEVNKDGWKKRAFDDFGEREDVIQDQ